MTITVDQCAYLIILLVITFVRVFPVENRSVAKQWRPLKNEFNRGLIMHRNSTDGVNTHAGVLNKFYSLYYQFVSSNATNWQRPENLTEAQTIKRDVRTLDKKMIQQISKMPKSKEIRVISFALYGNKPKYNIGAIRNAQLASVYFPGWMCRFYVTKSIPVYIIKSLRNLHAEIVYIDERSPFYGSASGMFWRFLVASDFNVDRYIVRDVDSRLSARDRFAVEEWINSSYPIHILRDHANHCRVMNGGLWGGIKGFLNQMKDLVQGWSDQTGYMQDLNFLSAKVWPLVRKYQYSHDSYCCEKFSINSHPFPTKRYPDFQHVGQVFDQHDQPRHVDIVKFMKPTPEKCRKQLDWIYG